MRHNRIHILPVLTAVLFLAAAFPAPAQTSIYSFDKKSGELEGILLSLTACVRADGTVSLEEAEALPTFTWRFRQEGGYRFRVIRADREAPDGMDSTARAAMEKALGRLRKTLADSAGRIPDGP